MTDDEFVKAMVAARTPKQVQVGLSSRGIDLSYIPPAGQPSRPSYRGSNGKARKEEEEEPALSVIGSAGKGTGNSVTATYRKNWQF